MSRHPHRADVCACSHEPVKPFPRHPAVAGVGGGGFWSKSPSSGFPMPYFIIKLHPTWCECVLLHPGPLCQSVVLHISLIKQLCAVLFSSCCANVNATSGPSSSQRCASIKLWCEYLLLHRSSSLQCCATLSLDLLISALYCSHAVV